MITTARKVPTWIVHANGDPAPFRAAGVETIPCPVSNGRLDLAAALRVLGGQGLTRVYCEGGGTLAASLLRAALVDRLELYTAGAAIGAEGVPGLGAMGLAALADAPRMALRDVRALGGDVLSVWERGDV